jgi:hypothetical protein
MEYRLRSECCDERKARYAGQSWHRYTYRLLSPGTDLKRMLETESDAWSVIGESSIVLSHGLATGPPCRALPCPQASAGSWQVRRRYPAGCVEWSEVKVLRSALKRLEIHSAIGSAGTGPNGRARRARSGSAEPHARTRASTSLAVVCRCSCSGLSCCPVSRPSSPFSRRSSLVARRSSLVSLAVGVGLHGHP